MWKVEATFDVFRCRDVARWRVKPPNPLHSTIDGRRWMVNGRWWTVDGFVLIPPQRNGFHAGRTSWLGWRVVSGVVWWEIALCGGSGGGDGICRAAAVCWDGLYTQYSTVVGGGTDPSGRSYSRGGEGRGRGEDGCREFVCMHLLLLYITYVRRHDLYLYLSVFLQRMIRQSRRMMYPPPPPLSITCGVRRRR